MKLSKKECKKSAETISNQGLKEMLDSARDNVEDWKKSSDINKRMSKGTAWNMFAKDFDVEEVYSTVLKLRLLQEFSEFLPSYLRPKKEFKKPEKKESSIKHEAPIFESDNNSKYYDQCMELLNELLYLKYDRFCQLCYSKMANKNYLMPIHILSKGAYKRLQFVLKNVVWGCDDCHKLYDEGTEKDRATMLLKMETIKKDPELLENLFKLYDNTDKLKFQEVKVKLKKLIAEERENE